MLDTNTIIAEAAQDSTLTTTDWKHEVQAHLRRAAELCAAHGVTMEAFMQGAANSYFDARPGLKEHLATVNLITQLELMRQAGRVATA